MSKKNAQLPFHPMLLTQFGAFHEKVKLAAKQKSNSRRRLPSRAAGPFEPPFFICPKLDGVRCISYLPRSTTTSSTPMLPFQSCFSRRGLLHPLMPPIERDLWAMRVLAGDRGLTLDGEIYIHNPPTPSTLTALLASSPKTVAAPITTTGMEKQSPQHPLPLPHIPPTLQLQLFDLISLEFSTHKSQHLFECSIPSMRPVVGAISKVQNTTAKAYKTRAMTCTSATTFINISEGTSTFIQRLRAMTFLFDLVASAKTTMVQDQESVTASTLWDRLGEEYDRKANLPPQQQPGAKRKSTTSSIKGNFSRVSMVQYDLIWDSTLNAALDKVGEYVDQEGYEGAVVRSGMDIYTAALCTEKVETVRSGYRSPTSVKLVPHYDQEYRLISIARIWGEGDDKRTFQVNLECSTDAGVCFRVNASTKDFPSLLQQHHDDASHVFTPGCFVTLKFPAFISPSSQVPLLPRVKGVRGLTKAHFL